MTNYCNFWPNMFLKKPILVTRRKSQYLSHEEKANTCHQKSFSSLQQVSLSKKIQTRFNGSKMENEICRIIQPTRTKIRIVTEFINI